MKRAHTARRLTAGVFNSYSFHYLRLIRSAGSSGTVGAQGGAPTYRWTRVDKAGPQHLRKHIFTRCHICCCRDAR